MTVCIAAIYQGSSIIGVSDRMITAGDIQFEPPASKINKVTTSIAIMTAGDANIQQQLIDAARSYINKKIDEDPDKWLSISDIAEFYRDCYIELRSKLAEKALLAPLGLTYESFLEKQKEMAEDFISDITFNLRQFYIESAHTIITGIDDSGPHIYVVRDDTIEVSDKVGFAAVGIGTNHALSHFMLSKYSPSANEPKALLTIHQAKKKSEVSPGIGADTDMFVVGPTPGSLTIIEPIENLDIIKDLDEFYKSYVKAINDLDDETEHKIRDYLDDINKQPEQDQKVEIPAVETNSEVSKKPTATETVKKSAKK
jgi:20S proteasome alpha/beta subunit